MAYLINEEKYQEAIDILKLASKMSEQYYGKPLLLAYSGGKDSDVLLQLAIESEIDFEVQNSHTTVDAPETVYHIRKVFDRLNKEVPHCKKAYVLHATYKDGKRITMWNLIPFKKMPPTRIARYCCKYLKETTTPNRMVALGVRKAESTGRKGRTAFESRGSRKDNKITKSYEDALQVYKDAQTHDEVWDCKFIELAKKHHDTVCNPIIDWTDEDVWRFIHNRGIEYNPLYDKGFKRVGCFGCPMASKREREREFAMYPQIKLNYIKAFDRMLKAYKTKQKADWKNGEDVFKWWIEDETLEGQMSLFDEVTER